MSGPIVRKYGFPNFEKIFGERTPQHGIDDAEAAPAATPTEPAATSAPAPEPAEDAPAAEKTPARSRKKK